jgi:predicted RNA-binding Zn ribbon-like protein
MDDTRPTIETLPLTADALCLDFVNTLDGRLEDERNELLRAYADLLRFGVRTESLNITVAGALSAAADEQPGAAAAVLRRAHALREALFDIFQAVSDGTTPAGADLHALNAERAVAEARNALGYSNRGFTRRFADDLAFDRPLWPIVLSAVALLQHGDLARIHLCAADDCAAIFLDTTRNRSRRWCTRDGCGNRARVRQFRERRRSR